MEFDPTWFDAQARLIVAEAIEKVVRDNGYTCWAFCVCSNHSHILTRVHKDPGHKQWELFAEASRNALRASGLFCEDHPVWAARPYVVFKSTTASVYRADDYIVKNPTKEGLPKQFYPWVTPYDGWPRN